MLQFETLFGLEPLPILIIYLDEFPSGQMRQGEDVQMASNYPSKFCCNAYIVGLSS